MGKVMSQKENWHSLIENLYPYEKSWDLVKVVMCALVSRVQMMFYTLRKGYTVPGNQGIHDKLNKIRKF